MNVYIQTGDITDMQGPCPAGFHVPLSSEWQDVYNVWTSLGGGSSDGTNFGIALKLPFAGLRGYSSAAIDDQYSYGYYWSSSPSGSNYPDRARYLLLSPSRVKSNMNYYRAYGLSVRCFKDSSVTPTSSWTKLYGTSIESGGIFWNSTDGLISLSSDGSTWITMQDKNLGATTVWNSSDILSQNNCGYYYQWGNNYGFPRTGSVTTSSSQVDASSYGPGNYYESSTFITRSSSPYGWDSSNNDNLRGGETGPISMKEVQNIYIGEYTGEPITISGIYWDETQGLISLSSNGSTWITIADKNLGATQVYNYGDTLSESNCGKWYQWGNNYGFSYSGTPSSSTTQLDISSYGPNNYLNSSTFRKIPSGSDSSWRPYTPSNYTAVKNLWGGYTDTLVARRGPCDEGWHIPSYTEANNINTMLLSIFGISSFNSIKTDVITYLKRPAAGTLNGFLTGIDGPGNYLKTMISDYYNGSNSNYYCFEILLPYTSSSFVSINSGSYASTIRPFKNESVQPTSKWTKLK